VCAHCRHKWKGRQSLLLQLKLTEKFIRRKSCGITGLGCIQGCGWRKASRVERGSVCLPSHKLLSRACSNQWKDDTRGGCHSSPPEGGRPDWFSLHPCILHLTALSTTFLSDIRYLPAQIYTCNLLRADDCFGFLSFWGAAP
jgi:hypothetical protein